MRLFFNQLLSVIIIIFTLSAPMSALAHDDVIKVDKVEMPKLPPVSRSAAIYLTIKNTGKNSVKLTSVNTDVAHHAMIHQTVEENGMAKMRHQDSLIIAAGGELVFQRGSYHIMLMGLDKEKMAKPFQVTLEFENRKPVTVLVTPQG